MINDKKANRRKRGRVKPRVLDLFSGIGGFSLGLERAGMQTVAFCEIEPFCQKVLNKHWPIIPIYGDIRDVTKEKLEADGINGIDVITGGFPCQDISAAGKQAGIEGERSGLWSELARIIGDVRPQFAILENVRMLISGGKGRWFGRVLGDMAEIGYDCEWHCIPASEIGAHHHRDRVWIIAYPRSRAEVPPDGASNGWDKRNEDIGGRAERARERAEHGFRHGGKVVADATSERQQESRQPIQSLLAAAAENWQAAHVESGRINGIGPTQSQMGGSVNGLSAGLDRNISDYPRKWADGTWEDGLIRAANGIPDRAHRLRGLGNAVVPQIPEIIGRAIMESSFDSARKW